MPEKATDKSNIQLTRKLLRFGLKSVTSKKQAEKIARQLREVIRYHDQRYYIMNEPVISDAEYDQLFNLLKTVERKWPELISPDSPTQRIAVEITEKFPRVRHLTPMLSLDNSYNENDLLEFDRRVKSFIRKKSLTYTAEPKFDGTGISLVYENDLFVRGATRGDGAVGEDITNNLKVLRSIPLSARFSGLDIAKIELRGEVIMKKDTFKKLNDQRAEEGLTVFANPRNAAAGSLRLQNPKLVAKRGLEVIIHQVSFAADRKGSNAMEKNLRSHKATIRLLHQLGFLSPYKQLKPFRNIRKILEYCHEWEEKRDNFPYEIDGMVIKVDDYRLYKDLKVTSHHPRWAMAFKFQARQATTTLLKVDFSVGRTGVITPVANLQTVNVGGVSVSSASLHNEDFIKSRDIRIKDKVLIERAGDVIPYVVKPIKEARTGREKEIHFPKKCPSCGAEIARPEGESAWRCVNINCPAQVLKRIIHFVSKSAMDVEGFSKKLVQRFYQQDMLKSIPDIYHQDYEWLKKWKGFGEKSVQNLKNAVEASKDRPPYRLINGLGIPFVGLNTARLLAGKVNCVEDLEKQELSDLLEIQDIGPKVAQSIYNFFRNQQNIHTIRELKKWGVNTCSKGEEAVKTGPLKGLTLVFTGSLEHFTREEAQELAEKLGASITSSVSSNTDFLIAGKAPGSKLEKARELNVKVIDEKEFMKMVKKKPEEVEV